MQLDMFAPPIDVPATMAQVHALAAALNTPAPEAAPDPDAVTYTIVPLRAGGVGINWRRGDRSGVIGGLYADVPHAQAVIDANRAHFDATAPQRRTWPLR